MNLQFVSPVLVNRILERQKLALDQIQRQLPPNFCSRITAGLREVEKRFSGVSKAAAEVLAKYQQVKALP